MGLSVSDLYNLIKKPKRSKVNIQLLQEYYETYLRPFTFRYKLSDGTVITLKFQRKQFSHLLGVETVAKQEFKSEQKLKTYRGDRAYKRIKDGEITDHHLRGLNDPVFYGKAIRGKFIYFYQIPYILLSPEAMFRYKKVSGSDIECEILIYDTADGVCVHLGIEKDNSGRFYIPRTFFAESGTRYVQNQTDVMTVDKIEQLQSSNGALVRSIDLKALRETAASTETTTSVAPMAEPETEVDQDDRN